MLGECVVHMRSYLVCSALLFYSGSYEDTSVVVDGNLVSWFKV